MKQVLTDISKTELFNAFSEEKKRYEMECEQLDFERRKALKHNHKKNNPLITMRFNEEIQRRKEKVRTLDFQIEQLKLLPLGTEVVEKEIEMVSQIQIGDEWSHVVKPAEIVVKDGIVIEIRE